MSAREDMSSSSTEWPPQALETNPARSQPPIVLPAQAATHSQPESSPTVNSFLDLPLEIRELIYSYFTCLPASPKVNLASDRTAYENRIATARTRLHLQLICRQINHEWSPIFYKSTIIAIHGSSQRLESLAEGHGWDELYNLRRPPSLFSKNFLVKSHSHIFPHVRKLHYRADNESGAGIIVALLQAAPVLGALEEILVSYPGSRVEFHRTRTPVEEDWHYMWEKTSTRLYTAERGFQILGRGGPCHGWAVVRKLKYENNGNRYNSVEVQLVFQKPSIRQASVSETEDGCMVELPGKWYWQDTAGDVAEEKTS